MDKEEKYWSTLEKLYVHNVYENISHQYDQFLKIAPKEISYDCDESSDVENETKSGDQSPTYHNHQKQHQHYHHLNDYNHNNNNHHQQHQDHIKETTNGIIKHGNHLKLDLNSINNNIAVNKLNKQKQYLKGVKNIRNSKHNPWPKVKNFLLQLERYSLIADVGCGDGKYLNVNNRILSIGSDRSISLCKLASLKHPPIQSVTNQNQLVICDNLALPFKSDYFDAVISIGVIHHFSTEKRRIQAVQELTRILRPSGKIMIYVWAQEQKLRKFNSQDVLVPMIDASRINVLKTSGDIKYRLRRDLSNNSTAESEDSTSEDVFEKSITMQENLILDKANNEVQDSTNTESLAEQAKPEQSESAEKSSASSSDSVDTRGPNFVENLRRFFARRFQLGSSSCEQKTSSPTTPINESARSVDDWQEDPVIERYKHIISMHKDKLPENFTIRRFPSSSCPDTFTQEDDQLTPKQISNVSIINVEDSLSNPNDALLSNTSSSDVTSSPSLTPSPINQYAPVINAPTSSSKPSSPPTNDDEDDAFLNSSSKNEQDSKEHSPSHQSQQQTVSLNDKTPNGFSEFLDELNVANKRFYHVFRRDELDNLIKSYCPSLAIYKSYYDHGNWCICAMKEN